MSEIYKDSLSNEWFYPSDKYILSETDEKGIIVYVNQLFCDIAGYTMDELLGEPHNIVRHKEMPRVAFKGLWDDLHSKGFWSGYVKNMRKDGGFYWVYATVLKRIVNGEIRYLSIRLEPSRSDVEKYSELYAELRENE